jgi:hypothetical protein
MKIKITLSVVLMSILSSYVIAQQASPIDMLYAPRENTFAISGVGGSNMYLQSKKASSSGQIALDWNIALKDGYSKRNSNSKYTTLTTIFKYNPLAQTEYESKDSVEMKKIGFVDNEFNMMLGLRLSSVTDMGYDAEAKLFKNFFIDGTMSPYSLTSMIDSNKIGFKNFNINGGLQLGYITNTDFGIVGFTITPEFSFISIYEDQSNGRAFEQLFNSPYDLSHSIMGWGMKVTVPLNDFCFFFEFRNYYPVSNDVVIRGLTDQTIFSFGGVATGTVFKAHSDDDSGYY